LSTPFGSASATAEPAEPVSLADGNSLRETSRKARTSVSTPGTELPVVAVRHRLPHTTALNRLEQTATTALPKGRKVSRIFYRHSEVDGKGQKTHVTPLRNVSASFRRDRPGQSARRPSIQG
jgi:hypothetical protein